MVAVSVSLTPFEVGLESARNVCFVLTDIWSSSFLWKFLHENNKRGVSRNVKRLDFQYPSKHFWSLY